MELACLRRCVLLLNISLAHRCAGVCITARGSSVLCHYRAGALSPHLSHETKQKQVGLKELLHPPHPSSHLCYSQNPFHTPPLPCRRVKKGSCQQHMPLSRQKQQTNLCHNRKRLIMSFTQPWPCSTPLLQFH